MRGQERALAAKPRESRNDLPENYASVCHLSVICLSSVCLLSLLFITPERPQDSLVPVSLAPAILEEAVTQKKVLVTCC